MGKQPKGRFTIGQLAELAGVSTRTLRYYEDRGLLSPARDSSGYRSYGNQDVKRLAQIIAMRACGLPLTTIGRMFDDPAADVRGSLVEHLSTLRMQGASLKDAMARTEAAIAAIERIDGMEGKDAFESLKAEGLQRFEDEFGKEARERYGEDVIEAANERMMSLTRDEWDAKELLEESVKVQLRLAMADGDVKGEAAAALARMHERWIRMHWAHGYSKEAHLGLARGYLADSRFRDYYDGACGEGATDFLVLALEENL